MRLRCTSSTVSRTFTKAPVMFVQPKQLSLTCPGRAQALRQRNSNWCTADGNPQRTVNLCIDTLAIRARYRAWTPKSRQITPFACVAT